MKKLGKRSILFLSKLKKTATETFTLLREAQGEDTRINEITFIEWLQEMIRWMEISFV